MTKLERATTMALLGKLKHDANLKNNSSEIKLNKRVIRLNKSVYSCQFRSIEQSIKIQNSMKRLITPNPMKPFLIPLSETPSPAN